MSWDIIIPSIELSGHDVIAEPPITAELSPATQMNGVEGTLIALLHNYGDTSWSICNSVHLCSSDVSFIHPSS
ncbi:hypothetical protein E4T56_gene5456 [Termitomyces sp. T112]|nr:hypothetical protein E4T56_gene5456 [Termitomyces sp. T112]